MPTSCPLLLKAVVLQMVRYCTPAQDLQLGHSPPRPRRCELGSCSYTGYKRLRVGPSCLATLDSLNCWNGMGSSSHCFGSLVWKSEYTFLTQVDLTGYLIWNGAGMTFRVLSVLGCDANIFALSPIWTGSSITAVLLRRNRGKARHAGYGNISVQ